jgi:LmbE family N-acetylglucosaminyl deacetylase
METAPAADPLAAFSAILADAGRHEESGAGVAVVVAHPDDETIGIGGHLGGLKGVHIVHVTDGAPRDLVDARTHGFENWQDYAAARRRELEAAMAEAGITPDSLTAIGLPDKEAARHLAGLARELAIFLAAVDIDYVCTLPFEGGHPDHDATAFAVRAACRLLQRENRQPPAIIEMGFYHAGPDGPVFQDFCAEPPVACLDICLANVAHERKQHMLACHYTQRQILAPFTLRHERFRAAPDYDFNVLPNGGRLYYEALPLGFTGADWLQLARAAGEELGLGRP